MLKKCVGVMMLFFPVALCAQVTRPYTDSVEQAHYSSAKKAQSQTDYLLKSAKVSQAAAQAQFQELVKAYPAQAADVRHIADMHKWLANLLRNEQKQPLDKNFYQRVLFLLEDLASAVSGIKDKTLAQACTTAIDHGYYFAPMGQKLSSLRVITERVSDEITTMTGGYGKPQWGDFYQYLDGYSN